jgi:alkanesulfonate monooxygenase SsuD/methylene tetrahydromethanopterin reductase-like flavin-dependent oxidoreductase (luciferase family)
MIEIVRGVTTGAFFSYQGKHYQIPAIQITPAPSRPIPILIGGHAEAALKRAARLGDGWMHAGGDAAVLDGYLTRLHELRRDFGRETLPFEVHVIAMEAYTLDGVRRLEDRGITDCIVGFRNAYESDTMSLQQKIDALRGYADRIIAKL